MPVASWRPYLKRHALGQVLEDGGDEVERVEQAVHVARGRVLLGDGAVLKQGQRGGRPAAAVGYNAPWREIQLDGAACCPRVKVCKQPRKKAAGIMGPRRARMRHTS